MSKLLNKIKVKSKFREGFARVQFQDNSWGFINNKGNIIAKGFNYVYSFSEGFAVVKFQDNSWGFINKKGNIYKENKKTLINKNDPRLKGIEIFNLKEKLNKLLEI